MAKIGIFGGAFNPPHKEHFNIAKAALEECGFDSIVFLPSNLPPHKLIELSNQDRLNMLKLGIAECEMEIFKKNVELHIKLKNIDAKIGKIFEISDYELLEDKTHYTVDAIDYLREIYGEDISLIIGGDSLVDFLKWFKPKEILKKIPIVSCLRQGLETECFAAANLLKTYENKGIYLLKYLPCGISSSDIREDILLGLDARDKLHKSVFTYIEKQKLFCDYTGLIDQVKTFIDNEKTFQHTLRTAKYALQLNRRLKLNQDKVLISCLLHDLAKRITTIDAIDEKLNSSIGTNTKFNFSGKEIIEGIPSLALGTPVAHAFIGSILANKIFGVTDEEILSAIKYHTTAKPNMTKLEMLVYCADALEEGRDYKGVDSLRGLIENNFYEGFLACLEHNYQYLLSDNSDFYPLSKQAYEYYFTNNK